MPVAVVDTGIDMTHIDLASNLWDNPDGGGHGWDFACRDEGLAGQNICDGKAAAGDRDPTDGNGHGTHVRARRRARQRSRRHAPA